MRIGEAVRETLVIDLRNWGRVNILPESGYQEDLQAAGTAFGTFDFKNWAIIGAERLVKGVDCAPPTGEFSSRFEGSAIGGFSLLNRHLVLLRG